jgi:hypothetical protein
MPRVRRCQAHCRACARHFTGDRAFDLHRIGSFDDADNPRRCAGAGDLEAIHGKPVLEVATELGRCEVDEFREGVGIQQPVTLWRRVGADRVRARFAARKASEAACGSADGVQEAAA